LVFLLVQPIQLQERLSEQVQGKVHQQLNGVLQQKYFGHGCSQYLFRH